MNGAHSDRLLKLTALLLAAAGSLAQAQNPNAGSYRETDLVSNRDGKAEHTNANLVNAWGSVSSPTSPWWVNANGTGLSMVFDADGNPAPAANPIVVTIPPPGGSGTSAPTGIAFNSTATTTMDFQIASGRPAIFLFATEDGTIAGWNPNVNATTAVLKVNKSADSSVYKGLALGQVSGTGSVIYAADFHNGNVDVFDTAFNPVNLGSSAFRDASVPAGFAPFNVLNVGGSIFVTFAKQDEAAHDDVAGPGNGFVDQFTQDGTLVMRLETGPWLNSPWGIALAPSDFGSLSGRLLVGNFGSGQIASFDPGSGNFEGLMMRQQIHPTQIDGLWGIRFGNGGAAGPTNVLFFAAGPNHEADGLFGTLTPRTEGVSDSNSQDNRSN